MIPFEPNERFYAFLGLLHTIRPEWIAGAFVLIIAITIFVSQMRPRRFFFVRHGQTVQNSKGIRHGEEGNLTEEGQKQAAAAGQFLTQFHINKICASPYERTKETAAIINQYLKVPIIYSPLLVERRNPSQIIGRRNDDPRVKEIVDLIELRFHEDDYRYSDEENFTDLKKRARQALRLLSHQTVTETCVVTHGIFLKVLLCYILYGENLHATDYIRMAYFNPADNGGITICEYNPWKRWFSSDNPWEIITYSQRFDLGPIPEKLG